MLNLLQHYDESHMNRPESGRVWDFGNRALSSLILVSLWLSSMVLDLSNSFFMLKIK